VLVADSENYRVRRIAADGIVSTIAGTGSSRAAFERPARLPAQGAQIRTGDVAVAGDGTLYVATDKSILKEPKIVYHVVGADLVREQAPIDAVGVAMGATEQLYVVGNNTAARRAKDGTWTTIAGQARAGYNGDEILAVNADLSGPLGVAVGPDGSVYIADTGNNRVRRITPDSRIHTLAGTGEAGYSGDGGPATLADLNGPSAVAVAADGTVFVADSHNHRVRRVKPDGIIDTVAGTGWGGDGPERGLAVHVELNSPMGLSIGPDGSLYIADTGNSRVRRLWGAVLHR
jgi:sugar lactone lactonase YvrE